MRNDILFSVHIRNEIKLRKKSKNQIGLKMTFLLANVLNALFDKLRS